ncbi:MAG: NAD-dependent epimerase/dehydratase family protein [Acutalibacteraceae bacterium]
MKRAIITGATGSVGTALINELINHNVEVLVFCREGSARNINIPTNHLVKKVFCNLEQLAEIQNDTGTAYDVFYHFAWSGTTGSARNDMYLQNLNIKYSLDAVGAAKRFGCKKFIGAGSQAEYGRFEGVLKSDTPSFPENGYGMAKLCAGQMTRELCHELNMAFNWVRILSVYGPNDGSQSMVMSAINKLKNGGTPEFTKGEQMWDYLYSGDAANAFRRIGECGVDGKIYVLGSGVARPLKEYIEEIKNIVSPDSKLGIGAIPYPERQVMWLQADISELRKDTGFEPVVEFKDGITRIFKGDNEE